MKLIENLRIILVFLFRIFLIFKTISGLYLNYLLPHQYPLSGIYWYVIVIVIDVYLNIIFRTE